MRTLDYAAATAFLKHVRLYSTYLLLKQMPLCFTIKLERVCRKLASLFKGRVVISAKGQGAGSAVILPVGSVFI
jgi:hypothetical protein